MSKIKIEDLETTRTLSDDELDQVVGGVQAVQPATTTLTSFDRPTVYFGSRLFDDWTGGSVAYNGCTAGVRG